MKKNYSNEDLFACNQLAISWIATNQTKVFMANLKENEFPFTLTMFYALYRSGNTNLLAEAISNAKFIDGDAIGKAVIEEGLFAADDWDDFLITNNSKNLASSKALARHEMWQELLTKKDFATLAKHEQWELVDANAPENILADHSRVDAMIKRGFWQQMHRAIGGVDAIIAHNKTECLKEVFTASCFIKTESLSKAVKFAIEKNVSIATISLSDAESLKKCNLGEYFKDRQLWGLLCKIKEYDKIDWKAYYKETAEDLKDVIINRAKKSGHLDQIKDLLPKKWWPL